MKLNFSVRRPVEFRFISSYWLPFFRQQHSDVGDVALAIVKATATSYHDFIMHTVFVDMLVIFRLFDLW